MVIKKKIFDNFIDAYFGRKYWLEIIKKTECQARYFLILPHDDSELNLYMVKYAVEKIKENPTYHLSIISQYVNEESLLVNNLSIDYILLSEKKIMKIIKFYQLYKFSNSIFIGSIYLPEGNKLYTLVNNNIINLEQAVSFGVFNL